MAIVASDHCSVDADDDGECDLRLQYVATGDGACGKHVQADAMASREIGQIATVIGQRRTTQVGRWRHGGDVRVR